ncbi:nuclear transport factor 2 family protein (plasmid) [Nocardioides sp. R1-1]|uniref:nuclear transport factor 2 family protein n=1 Tax=Nocardioides sp. R1-1 TaxID=3383502 RepID=UPI0038CFD554
MTLDEARLRELLDRQAILDCLVRCARGVDRLDADLIRSAYHPDALDDHGMFVGDRDEFCRWAVELHTSAHIAHQHHLTNHTCRLDGDSADAETYFVFTAVNRPTSEGEAPTVVTSGGRYIDRLEQRAGEWRISVRLVVREWSVVHPTTAPAGGGVTAVGRALSSADVSLMGGGPTGHRNGLDPSYTQAGVRPERLAAGRAARGVHL